MNNVSHNLCFSQIHLWYMLIVKAVFQITVFRMEEGSSDIDLAILTALLKGEIQGLMERPAHLSFGWINLYLDG